MEELLRSTPTVESTNETTDEVVLSKQAAVKRWQERVLKAKDRYKEDMSIMRRNMEFVGNYQYAGQTKRDDRRYRANFILRLVKQKVATLYAKDPKTEFQRRERMDFAIWDEKIESLLAAVQQAADAVMMGSPVIPPEAQALIEDYETGSQWRELIDRYGKTLQILYQIQLDTQEPEFKQQAKDCVDRTCVCGVSYARISYCSYQTKQIAKSSDQPTDADRVEHARELLRQVDEGEIQMDDAQLDTLRSLIRAVGTPTDAKEEQYDHLQFDFPPSTTIIPDPRCRRLKGFVGARWVAQEYVLPLEFVNTFFNLKITGNGDITTYHENGQRDETNAGSDKSDKGKEPLVCVWEIIDKSTKSRCFICDGHKDYLLEPEPFENVGRVFWPWFPLVFNAVETDKECKTSIFPPSDVELGTPQQMEWNRTREALRGQRKANAPKYLYAKDQVSHDDVKKIVNAEPNQCLAVTPPVNGKISEMLVPLQVAQIDPNVYNTEPIKEDLLLATGAQEANIGPAQPNITATNSTIAEQSRMTVASSNIDDVDDWLSDMAYYGGGLLSRNMDRETVVFYVGRGATWPDVDRDLFTNEVFLRTVSGSSGRPNMALELNKATQLVPLMVQAGANPLPILRKLGKILDDQIPEDEFFPISGMSATPASQPQQPNPSSSSPSSNGEGQMYPSNVKPVEKGTAEVAA